MANGRCRMHGGPSTGPGVRKKKMGFRRNPSLSGKRSKADELSRAQGTFLRRGTLHVGWELTCGGPYDHHPV